MDIRISMRQLEANRWVASDGARAIEAEGSSREECLDLVRERVRDALGDANQSVTLIVEVMPLVAGVAEAASVMGWDKRRVITYIDRGRFPEPLQALASGRIWLRSDVERFAEQWRARQAERKGRALGGTAEGGALHRATPPAVHAP